MLMVMRCWCSSTIRIGHALRVMMLVAHLRTEARTTASAHEAVTAKVGHLEGRQLARDLPILACKQDNRP